ncbi:versican core protein-like isoform X1 [Acipenser oxyrinchus oxyrinchus]|uniref:Versican core protein-like isoform X1 n=1 Tax=Acipenser oxyrinchus oxyrinchus TaxID=40147 RepID=A0AAD8GG74_ACIOX|nr:versican core protein-like isoform X1 [Acipenser oxyrinchus oxyrinchus]
MPSSDVQSVLTGQISLRGGRNRFEGLVEVEYRGHQGGICAKRWDNGSAAVVCRQLGFSGMAWATSSGVMLSLEECRCLGL